ncbi:MAG: DUF2164 domain-containing protein [Verrucomicrobiota bacterium]
MKMELEKEERVALLASIQRYFRDELEQEICEMRSGLLLDFFFEQAGPYAYNKGVGDAEAYFRDKLEDLSASCYEHPKVGP